MENKELNQLLANVVVNIQFLTMIQAKALQEIKSEIKETTDALDRLSQNLGNTERSFYNEI